MAFLKNIWKANSKHKKLSEELALQNSKETDSELNENEVITFKLKYLGSTIVEKITGDNISTEAVKNIIKVAKAGRKKLQRVLIAISLKGIAVSDLQGNDLFKISIYRISNCSTDPDHRQVFSFVSTDQNDTMECHAFLCNKRKQTETVTLAVAHAFRTAYEAWRILPPTQDFPEKAPKAIESYKEEKLIDFDDDSDFAFGSNENYNNKWVCFDDDFGGNLRNDIFA